MRELQTSMRPQGLDTYFKDLLNMLKSKPQGENVHPRGLYLKSYWYIGKTLKIP